MKPERLFAAMAISAAIFFATQTTAAPISDSNSAPAISLVAGNGSAERDRKRRGYVAGLNCSFVSHGQPVRLKYEAGGSATMTWQEGDIYFKWSIQDDVFCLQPTDGGENRCAKLPKRELSNDREALRGMLMRSCM